MSKTKIGDSSKLPGPKPEKGYSVWIESGIWYTAPTVDKKLFGPHAYAVKGAYERGERDCSCGCFMLSSSSGGPVDPFGACPKNPKPEGEHLKNIPAGFEWGSAKLTRGFSDESKGWVTILLETPKHLGNKSLQIYVTKTGKVRIHDSRGEWKPAK